MTEILSALLLGVIQGITEFLPISSSGHLVIAHHLLHFKEGDVAFDVVLHLATLMVVLVMFGRDLAGVVATACLKGNQGKSSRRVLFWIVVGSVPAAAVGLLAKDQIESVFQKPQLVGFLLIGNGALLLVPKWLAPSGDRTLEQSKLSEVVGVGLAQALAILPGISRSGSTITIGLLCGFNGQQAARFSFFLFIPAVLGATALEARQLIGAAAAFDWPSLLIGFFAALVTGYVALRWLLDLLRHGRFYRFGYYCIVIGLVALVFFLR